MKVASIESESYRSSCSLNTPSQQTRYYSSIRVFSQRRGPPERWEYYWVSPCLWLLGAPRRSTGRNEVSYSYEGSDHGVTSNTMVARWWRNVCYSYSSTWENSMEKTPWLPYPCACLCEARGWSNLLPALERNAFPNPFHYPRTLCNPPNMPESAVEPMPGNFSYTVSLKR